MTHPRFELRSGQQYTRSCDIICGHVAYIQHPVSRFMAACRANYTVTVDGWPSSANPSPDKPLMAEGSGGHRETGKLEAPEAVVNPAAKKEGRGQRKRSRSRSMPHSSTTQAQLPGDSSCRVTLSIKILKCVEAAAGF